MVPAYHDTPSTQPCSSAPLHPPAYRTRHAHRNISTLSARGTNEWNDTLHLLHEVRPPLPLPSPLAPRLSAALPCSRVAVQCDLHGVVVGRRLVPRQARVDVAHSDLAHAGQQRIRHEHVVQRLRIPLIYVGPSVCLGQLLPNCIPQRDARNGVIPVRYRILPAGYVRSVRVE